jgi:hypothetical protein
MHRLLKIGKPNQHQKYGDQNKYIFKDSYLLLRTKAGTKLLLAVATTL